jgi:hypothetical protein
MSAKRLTFSVGANMSSGKTAQRCILYLGEINGSE